MNRVERRKLERQGVSQKSILSKYREDVYEQGYRDGMEFIIDVMWIMMAYTINYKFGFGKKRLKELMTGVLNNVDSFRTGQLSKEDFRIIKQQMEEMGVGVKTR